MHVGTHTFSNFGSIQRSISRKNKWIRRVFCVSSWFHQVFHDSIWWTMHRLVSSFKTACFSTRKLYMLFIIMIFVRRLLFLITFYMRYLLVCYSDCSSFLNYMILPLCVPIPLESDPKDSKYEMRINPINDIF